MFGHFPALYRDTRNVHKRWNMTAKTRAIPHRVKIQYDRETRIGAETQTHFIAGPLWLILSPLYNQVTSCLCKKYYFRTLI